MRLTILAVSVNMQERDREMNEERSCSSCVHLLRMTALVEQGEEVGVGFVMAAGKRQSMYKFSILSWRSFLLGGF